MRGVAFFAVAFLFFGTTSPISAFSKNPRIVAFTFDDGPRPKFLSQALPLFAKEKVPATFFVIGETAAANPEWLKKEILQGDEVENHTMHHFCLVRPSPQWTACENLSIDQALMEVELASGVIKKITGDAPHFLRPPHFAMTKDRRAALEKAANIYILTHGGNSIGSLDWVYTDPQKVIDQVETTLRERGDGSYVIVFHENPVTLKALPAIIQFFRDRGYEFVRLDELHRQNPKADI